MLCVTASSGHQTSADRVGKGRRRLEADPRSPDAEGEVGRMVELQRGGQVEARSSSYHILAVEMRLGQGRRKVHAGAGRTRFADGGDGNRFLVRGGADGQLVAHNETVHVADFDIGRAGLRISRERRHPAGYSAARAASLPSAQRPLWLSGGIPALGSWVPAGCRHSRLRIPTAVGQNEVSILNERRQRHRKTSPKTSAWRVSRRS